MSNKRKSKDQDLDPKRGKHSETLQGLVVQICTAFVEEMKMDPDSARNCAALAVETIRESAKGGVLYVAKGHLYAITERHRTIYRRFTGHNHFQLAKEFDLSERQIYTIVERCGAESFERKQPSLFDKES
jgi:Mor family transcriptional regulator